jgi:two-component system LytT family response regulator
MNISINSVLENLFLTIPITGNEITVFVMGKPIVIMIDNITHLEAEGSYTVIYTYPDKIYLMSKCLKTVTKGLNTAFFRVHRSFVVNLAHIVKRSDDGRIITMSCGKEVKVSKRKICETKKLLNVIENQQSCLS